MKDLREKPTRAELRKARIEAAIVLPLIALFGIITYLMMIP